MGIGRSERIQDFSSALWVSLLFISAIVAFTTAAEADQGSAGRVVGDSLVLSDSLLIPVDSAQPEVRVGGTTLAGVSTAHVEALPIDPGLAPLFGIGLRSELEFSTPLFFLFELEFISRRLYSESTFPTSGRRLTQEFFFSYLQFPLLFRLSVPIAERFDLSGSIGAAPAVLLSSSQTLSDGLSDTTLSIDRGLEQFDFSIDTRLGAEYVLTPRSSLVLELRYLLGMQNLLILAPGEDPRVWKGRALGLTIGWMYQVQRPIYRD